MTSSNGNIFRVTGPLCGEFTGHRLIPITKTSDAELWCFLQSVPWINGWVNNREAGDLRRHRAHYGVFVMQNWQWKSRIVRMQTLLSSTASDVVVMPTPRSPLTTKLVSWRISVVARSAPIQKIYQYFLGVYSLINKTIYTHDWL